VDVVAVADAELKGHGALIRGKRNRSPVSVTGGPEWGCNPAPERSVRHHNRSRLTACLTDQSGPRLLQQHRHRLTQSQPASGGVEEEESGERNKASSLELSSFSRLVSRLSCSVSFSIRSLSLLTRKISFSIRSLSFLKACMRVSKSGSRCQLSVAPRWRAVWHNSDKNCRQRGNDENDAPLLLEGDGGAGECDVVIGREQGDKAEGQSADGLGEAEPVETETGEPQEGAW
jgi:hypothetical protein